MNFLKKIFGQEHSSSQSKPTIAESKRIEQIQRDTDLLWLLLKDTVANYNAIACPCAFPRFIQYVSIDCSETSNSYYMSETEGFIYSSKDYFEHKPIDKGDECEKSIWICKTCASTFVEAWSDFSIHVNRTYLKPLHLQAKQVGADPEEIIPFYVGLFGHSLPSRDGFRQVDYETFKNYIQSVKV